MSNLNEQFIFQAKEILKLITSTGQEAYIVGESLRDLVLDQNIREVEIFTSLSKANLVNLFNEDQIIEILDNAIRVHHLGLNFRISLSSYYNFDPKVKIKTPRRHYSTSLMDFLETKIYSVNTLAMANNNVIYDCFNGRQDILKKRIRMICDNPQSVFVNDPVKMLEAIRLVSELGFRLDKNVFKAIRKKNKGLLKVDVTTMTKEMVRIVSGKYARRAIKLLIKSKLFKRMPMFKYCIKKSYEHFNKTDPYIFVGASLIKNKGYKEEVGRALDNPIMLEKIVEAGMRWPKSNYDVTTLFNNPLDHLLKANLINYSLGRAKNKQRQITKLYNRLVIKNIDDLAFNYQDILGLNEGLLDFEIEDILKDVCTKVLSRKLKNKYDDIKNYILKELDKKGPNTLNMPTEEKSSQTDAYSKNILRNSNLNNKYQESVFQDNPPKDNLFKDDLSKDNPSVVDDVNSNSGYQESLFTDNDFIEEKQHNYEAPKVEQNISPEHQYVRNEYNSASIEFEMLRRQQIELDRRVSELEYQHLEKELNEEIEKKIKQSGLLDGLVGSYRESTYNTLRKVYYDVLVKTEKYQRLESKGENYGQN